MVWNEEADQMKIDFPSTIGKVDEVITKRVVFATTAKMFDPIGMISTVIVPLKLVCQ